MSTSTDNKNSVAYEASTGTLIKVSSAAVGVAAVLLALVVLPAERGIDVTGLGKAMGLTQMAKGEDKGDDTPVATATNQAEVAVPEQTKANISKETTMRSDEMSVTLAPHEGTEIKAHMKKGDHLIFRWDATAPVKADMHGEKLDAADGEFTQYWKEKDLISGQGAFTAPFDGKHGWYFRNQGETPLTVKIKTSGFYQDLFEPKPE